MLNTTSKKSKTITKAEKYKSRQTELLRKSIVFIKI